MQDMKKCYQVKLFISKKFTILILTFNLFLIIFILIVKNVIKKKDPPILFWKFFDRISSFRSNHEKYY